MTGFAKGLAGCTNRGGVRQRNELSMIIRFFTQAGWGVVLLGNEDC